MQSSYLDLIAAVTSVSFFLAGGMAVLLRRIDLLLTVLVASLAIRYGVAFAGVSWTPTRIVHLWALFCLATNRDAQRWIFGRGAAFVFPALGVLAASLLASRVITPGTHVTGTGLQSVSMRPLVQSYHYVSGIAVVALAATAIRTHHQLRTFFDRYLVIAVLASIVGWIQLACIATGVTFLPILRHHGVHTVEATFQTSSGDTTHRLYGVSGEPKHLAALLLPIILALLLTSSLRVRLRGVIKHHRLWLIAIVPVFILTFSTGGYISAAFSIFALMTMSAGLRKSSTIRWVAVGSMVLVMAVGAAKIFQITETRKSDTDLLSLVVRRTAGRIEQAVERSPEGQLANHLLKEPMWIPFGYGPGMYVYHVRGFVHDEKELGVRTVGSGWIALAADLGLSGCLLAACGVFAVWAKAGRTATLAMGCGPMDYALHVAACTGMIGAACLSIGLFGWTALSLFCGMTLASADIARRGTLAGIRTQLHPTPPEAVPSRGHS